MNKFAMIIFVYALVGCGSSSFSGDSDAAKIQKGQTAVLKGEEHSEIKEEPVTDLIDSKKEVLIDADTAEDILAEDGELTDDDKKLVGCIEQWGQAGISAEAIRGYKKLIAKNEGFASSVLKDTKQTPEARLVFVSASSTGFSGVRMELLNPNGWYCVDVKNIGFSGSNLMLHCQSELAG